MSEMIESPLLRTICTSAIGIQFSQAMPQAGSLSEGLGVSQLPGSLSTIRTTCSAQQGMQLVAVRAILEVQQAAKDETERQIWDSNPGLQIQSLSY